MSSSEVSRKRPRPAAASAPVQKSSTLRFQGSGHFRQRVVCSIHSGKPLRIDEIRSSPLSSSGHADDIQLGLVDFEASFLRLVDKLTNGTKVSESTHAHTQTKCDCSSAAVLLGEAPQLADCGIVYIPIRLCYAG